MVGAECNRREDCSRVRKGLDETCVELRELIGTNRRARRRD